MKHNNCMSTGIQTEDSAFIPASLKAISEDKSCKTKAHQLSLCKTQYLSQGGDCFAEIMKHIRGPMWVSSHLINWKMSSSPWTVNCTKCTGAHIHCMLNWISMAGGRKYPTLQQITLLTAEYMIDCSFSCLKLLCGIEKFWCAQIQAPFVVFKLG